MILGTTILLASFCTALAEMITQPDPDCDFVSTIAYDQILTLNSPEWPAVYKQNQVCRWILSCPPEHNCRLRCNFVAIPVSHGCDVDKLLVSPVGSIQLLGAQVYCGRAFIEVKSVNQRLTIGLKTNHYTPGGRFKCLVTTVKSYLPKSDPK